MNEKLKQLLETIEKTEKDVENRELFTAVVAQYLALGTVDPAQMARDYRVSVGTIMRWRDGQSAPHPIGRASVYRFIKEKVQAHAKQ